MEKTNNLYENWVKKPEMIFLLEESNKHPLFSENQKLIYIIMIEVIYNHINKNLHLLTTDNQQLGFYRDILTKIYTKLNDIYNKKDYKIYHYGIYYYYYKNKINHLLDSLIDYDIDEEYLPIESFFRGIHQIIEINLLYLIKNQNIIETLINIEDEYVKYYIYKNISIWSELIELLNLLSSMDELQYQKYRNLIYGTSGGESVNLRKIQKRIQNLDQSINSDIREVIMNQKNKKYLVSTIKIYQYYSTQFWLTHFNLAASTNGIQNKGTKETPILKLIDRCITMTDTKINNVIHEISKEVKDNTYKKKVIINDKERLIGISVYNSSKELFEDQ